MLTSWVAREIIVAVPAPPEDVWLETVVGPLDRLDIDALQLSSIEQFTLRLKEGRMIVASGALIRHPIESLERDLGSGIRTQVELAAGYWEFALGQRTLEDAATGAPRLLLAALSLD